MAPACTVSLLQSCETDKECKCIKKKEKGGKNKRGGREGPKTKKTGMEALGFAGFQGRLTWKADRKTRGPWFGENCQQLLCPVKVELQSARQLGARCWLAEEWLCCAETGPGVLPSWEEGGKCGFSPGPPTHPATLAWTPNSRESKGSCEGLGGEGKGGGLLSGTRLRGRQGKGKKSERRARSHAVK